MSTNICSQLCHVWFETAYKIHYQNMVARIVFPVVAVIFEVYFKKRYDSYYLHLTIIWVVQSLSIVS